MYIVIDIVQNYRKCSASICFNGISALMYIQLLGKSPICMKPYKSDDIPYVQNTFGEKLL